MREVKMVDIKELEDVIHKEEVKAIRDSIDKKELKKRVKEYEKYKEYTKKSYHPMSYEIEKELRSAPHGLTDAHVHEYFEWAVMLGIGWMALWFMLGALFFIGILTSL